MNFLEIEKLNDERINRDDRFDISEFKNISFSINETTDALCENIVHHLQIFIFLNFKPFFVFCQ